MQTRLDTMRITSYIKGKAMRVEKIDDPTPFWILMDQMVDAKSVLYSNRVDLLHAFVRGALYTAIVEETDALHRDFNNRGRLADLLGSRPSTLALPCFCVTDEDGFCDLMWVREDLRRLGVGSLFVNELSIRSTSRQLEGSAPFWMVHGFKHSYPIE